MRPFQSPFSSQRSKHIPGVAMKATAIRSFAAIMIMAGVATAACAQAPYPNKPIRFIVAYVAGGANDVLARIVGQKLSEAWKQPVVIENKPGAAGLIGAD